MIEGDLNLLIDINKDEMNAIISALYIRIVTNTEVLNITISDKYKDNLMKKISYLQKLYDKYNVMVNLSLE